MRKQTDLAKVKQTARSLLFTDIHETEFSPVIVSHPFTDSGFVASPNANGEIGLLNITESDADQRRWREYMGKLIDGAKSAYEIYMMITKPYGLTFLKYTAQDLSQEDLSNILASAWTRAEAPNMDVNVSKAKLLSLSSRQIQRFSWSKMNMSSSRCWTIRLPYTAESQHTTQKM